MAFSNSMMALAVEAVVAEAVAALGRSSGHEATHHAPSEQGLSQTLSDLKAPNGERHPFVTVFRC